MTLVLSDEDQDFLLHYGVLGMRWGVRKQDDGTYAKTGSSADQTTGYEPDKPGATRDPTVKPEKPNAEQRQRIRRNIAIGVGVAAALGVTAYGAKQVGNYKSTTDFINKEVAGRGIIQQYGMDAREKLRKGHEFVRASNHKELGIRDRAFAVSNPAKDASKYAHWGDWSIKATATKDIVKASTKDKIDTIIEGLSTKDVLAEAGRGASLGDKIAYLRTDKRNIGATKLGRMTDQWWRGEESEKLVKDLLAKGFSAARDEMDGHDGSSASILFDKEAFTFEPTKIR